MGLPQQQQKPFDFVRVLRINNGYFVIEKRVINVSI